MNGLEKSVIHRCFGSACLVILLLSIILSCLSKPDGVALAARYPTGALFPNLLSSPVWNFDSHMMKSPVQYFDSRMMNSPAQAIGSPFAPYRFATLPSLVELWTARGSAGWLPAMLETPLGVLLLLPPYAAPQWMWVVAPMVRTVETAESPSKPRRLPGPKFITLRCGRFIEVTVQKSQSLLDVEQQSCE